MAKQYKGSLSLEWFNKQKAIVNLDENSIKSENDIPAPRINWINKEEALFYELNEEEGRGNKPYWVNRDDIRVKESRPLVFQKAFRAVEKDKKGTIPGTDKEFVIEEISTEESTIDIKNWLIKGDNLLALNSLKRHFNKLPDNEKVKCIYIDPPYNTGSAFEYYEDNVEHSEWLTLMRDRLVILKDCLASDGFIFVQMDNTEVFRLKLLMDEVFGTENFVNDIIWKRRGGSANPTNRLNNVVDYILWYRNSESAVFNPIYTLDDEKTQNYIKERFNAVFEGKKYMVAPIERNAKLGMRETLRFEYKGYTPKYGWMMSEKNLRKMDEENRLHWNSNGNPVRRVFLEDYPGQPISNLWTDIFVINPMSKERTAFDGGQKPEALIKRVLDFATKEGDLILDIFGGSGSTFAAAHKMNRRWIGVEIGNHADSLIIPRMTAVMEGKDDGGITKDTNWKGGGSFKYFHVGDSIISIDKETGKGEFNWKLGKSFVQESLLVSYDFVLLEEMKVLPSKLFGDEIIPSIGKLTGKQGKSIYGIAYLVAPGETAMTISNDEIKSIYNEIRKQSDFQSLVIYTNKGIDIAQDTIPQDLDIIKVPHAIFAELER